MAITKPKPGFLKWNYLFVFLILLVIACSIYYGIVQNRGGSSLEVAWHCLILAMKNNDMDQIKALTTKRGLASLTFGDDENENVARWHRWGELYTSEEVRWETIDEETVEAWVGPKSKEGAFVFVKTFYGWKLNELRPGA